MSRVFDGSQTGANETYIHTSTSAAINTLQALTLAAWVYPTSNTGEGVIAWKDGAAAVGPLLLNNGGKAFCQVMGTTSGTTALAPSNFTLNTWTHVAMTFDYAGDKKARLYINGSLVTTSAVALVGTVSDDSADGFWFGNDSNDDGYTGSIAEIVEYNYAMTALQVATLAASTAGAVPAGYVGYWHLDGTTSPEPDSSGNGDAGVLSTNPPTQGANSPGYAPPSSAVPFVGVMSTLNYRRTGIYTVVVGGTSFLVQEDSVSAFLLEDGSGSILLG